MPFPDPHDPHGRDGGSPAAGVHVGHAGITPGGQQDSSKSRSREAVRGRRAGSGSRRRHGSCCMADGLPRGDQICSGYIYGKLDVPEYFIKRFFHSN